MARLVEISAQEWLNIYRSVEVPGSSSNATLQDNLFGCMQWTGREAFEKSHRQYWSLELNGEAVSWVSSYFVSEKVIRLRGFITKSTKRRRGHMQNLLRKLIEHLARSDVRFICFVGPEAAGLCAKLGFVDVKEFLPRKVEVYDTIQSQWVEVSEQELKLMKYETKRLK